MPFKEDQWGEYNTEAGSIEPVTEDEVGYTPCNAVLKFTYSRYGETRYCKAMAVGNFGEAANYEYPEYCKHHQNRRAMKEQQEENFKTGAYVKTYEALYNYLPPHKQIMAIDLYTSLMDESVYDFGATSVVREVSMGEKTVHVDFPVATEHRARAASLYFASLDFIKIQNINEEQFRIADEETGPRGQSLTVGEDVFERETESGQTVEIKDEHHLNLPLSRIQKDYKEHMRFGGVPQDVDMDMIGLGGGDEREWVIEIDEPEPEASDGDSPVNDLEVPDG